jgi:hypothetical protein
MENKNTAPKKFKWNAELAAKAAELYLAKLEADGNEAANADTFLNEVASEIGAVSGKSIRGKLNRDGIYVTLEPKPAATTRSRPTKIQFVRAIAAGLGIEVDAIDSLDKANISGLESLVDAINVKFSDATEDDQPLIEVSAS